MKHAMATYGDFFLRQLELLGRAMADGPQYSGRCEDCGGIHRLNVVHNPDQEVGVCSQCLRHMIVGTVIWMVEKEDEQKCAGASQSGGAS